MALRHTFEQLSDWTREELIDAVQTLEGELERSWVLVGERLPGRDVGFVLLAVEWEDRYVSPPRAVRYGYYDDSDGHWRTQHGRLRGATVTHWMLLPGLPVGGGDDV